MRNTGPICPQAKIAEALDAAKRGNAEGVALIDKLIAEYWADPRLHFLKGSLLASAQRIPEAHDAMKRGVDLDENYHIARFQLGLLELTSGDVRQAFETWAPLDKLPAKDPLRLFMRGLQYMVGDDFAKAKDLLREGIARNTALPPLNRDMQMVIDEMGKRRVAIMLASLKRALKRAFKRRLH